MTHVRRTAVVNREMMVATRSFTARYDGEAVPIHAGRDRIDPRHEIVLGNPDAFVSERAYDERRRSGPALLEQKPPKPAWFLPPRDRRPAEAQARRVGLLEETLPKPAWLLRLTEEQGLPAAGLPTMRSAGSPVSIEIPECVLDQIEAEMLRVPRDFETGGLLLGRWSDAGGGVRLLEAWGAGPHATHRRASMELAWRHDLDRARRECRGLARVRPVGFWHSHPIVGHDTPSENDLRMFAAFHEEIRTFGPAPAMIGVIATPIERRYRRPPLTAWVVSQNRSGDRSCQRGSWVCR